MSPTGRPYLLHKYLFTTSRILVFAFLTTLLTLVGVDARGDGQQVAVFYLDHQFRPVVKLERLGALSEEVKAILAMYALQAGGGCDGHDSDGLNCKLTKSLGLGAQCSDAHLSIVRSWFNKEIPPMGWYQERDLQRSLKSGNFRSICYNTPYTATRQMIWEIIRVKKWADHVFVDAITVSTASADDPGNRTLYQTEYWIGVDTITVVAHKKLSVPRNYR